MQIWAESGKSALPICNYSQILYQFLTFTQNLKRSPFAPKLSSKFAPYLRNLVSHEEIGEIADWLVKYARSCALDAKINIDFNGNI